MAEPVTGPKAQALGYNSDPSHSRPVPLAPHRRGKRSRRKVLSSTFSQKPPSADPHRHTPDRTIIAPSESVASPANPRGKSFAVEVIFCLFLASLPHDLCTDVDDHSNGGNSLFDCLKSHNLLGGDDWMGVLRDHGSHFKLLVGHYEHRHRPGEFHSQRISVGPQTEYNGREHDAIRDRSYTGEV